MYLKLANIKSYEHELNQLRNLTNGQHETIAQYRQQIDDLKAELAGVTKKLEDEIYNCQEIKKRFELQLIEKEKEAINRIDIARGTIAMQWEDKLLDEMARLKMELEQIGLEEKQEALAKLRKETDEELTALTSTFTAKQEELEQEITSLKQMLEDKQKEYEELQAKSDTQMMETRLYLDRAERENQAILDKEIRKRESIIETMKKDHTQEVAQMEQKFNTRIERLQEEYQRDLSDQTELLKSRHKRELEDQWKQLVAEKEEALQSIESRHKKKIEEAENHISYTTSLLLSAQNEPTANLQSTIIMKGACPVIMFPSILMFYFTGSFPIALMCLLVTLAYVLYIKQLELITSHENALKELQEAHTSERSALEKRDSKNVQEIDTLHKKCRCLTKLFEEMRMRYERRDPRPEDLRQITELKSIVEAQDRDLRILTERFREIQIYQQHQQNMMHSHSLPPYAQVVAQQQQAQAQQQMPSQQGQSPQQQSQMIPPMRTKSKSRTPQKQLPNGTPLPPPPPPPPISTAMMQMFNATQNHMSPICEVIYEENEDNEQMNGHQNGNKERTPARMNGDTHIPPPVDQKAIVNDIINEVVASAHIQAHGLAESAF
uniref:CSON014246 protein n=1 Tax=Culicoides sonorensis TaxID=179676 RepID=A0A336KS93_CULSO